MRATNTGRINARLDDETIHKLDLIRRRTGQSYTEIVETSLDLYYSSLKAERVNVAEVLKQNGFIGCGSDSSDLSVNYKARLAELLARKT